MKLRLITLAFISVFFLTAASAKRNYRTGQRPTTMVELCYRIAAPVLENMSKGELQKTCNSNSAPLGTDVINVWLYGNVWQTDGRHLALAGIA